MSAARTIPPAVRRAQLEAADPEVSAFVSANAGSGKTHVLAQRVINLLLRGVDPAKILCITFTKAAAANMANRVFGTLANWTALDDDALDAEIRLGTGTQPDAAHRARARRLFASALETPGGLKVQTIHAFCTRLLHQFPFEANVAARFTVLDEAATAPAARPVDARTCCWKRSADPDSALGQALADGHRRRRRQDFQRGDRRGDRASATPSPPGSTRAGSIDAGHRRIVASFGVDPTIRRKAWRMNSSRPRSFPSGMAAADRGARHRLGQRQEAHRALEAAPRRAGPRAHRAVSEDLLHRRIGRRARTSHQEDR